MIASPRAIRDTSGTCPARCCGRVYRCITFARLDLRLDYGAHMLSRQGNVPLQVFDLQVFEDLLATLGNDAARVRNIYRKFLDVTTTRLDEIRRQSATETAAGFHALKGSAGMVGASRLAAAAGRCQEAAPGLTVESLAAALGEIEAEFSTFRRELGTHLDGLPPDP